MPKSSKRDTTPPHIARWLRQLHRVKTRAAATAKLCEAFEPLVEAMAARYSQPILGAEREDLEQVARVGLLESFKTFDRKKGAFPTHATWAIRSALALYVSNLENPVKLPRTLMFRLPKLRRMQQQLSQTLQREPTNAELAKATGLSEAAVGLMVVYDLGGVEFDRHYTNGRDTSWSPREERMIDRYPSPNGSSEDALMSKEEARRREKE